jgi:hypothetical protein
VNTHRNDKEIEVHKETNRPCRRIFQNIRKGGRYKGRDNGKFKLEVLHDGTIKTGDTDSGYWFIIWRKSYDELKDYIEELKRNGTIEVKKDIEVCKNCI